MNPRVSAGLVALVAATTVSHLSRRDGEGVGQLHDKQAISLGSPYGALRNEVRDVTPAGPSGQEPGSTPGRRHRILLFPSAKIIIIHYRER